MKERELERLKYKCNALIDKLQELDIEERELEAKIVYLAERKKALLKKKQDKAGEITNGKTEINSEAVPFYYPVPILEHYQENEQDGHMERIKVELLEVETDRQELRVIEAARNECQPVFDYCLSNNEIYYIVGDLSGCAREYEHEEVEIRHISVATVEFGDIAFLILKILGFLCVLAVVIGMALLLVSPNVRQEVLRFFTNKFV